jgi:hypothetical protein
MKLIFWIFSILLLLTVVVYAQTVPATGNFVYIDQIGNSNNTTVTQNDNEKKQAAVVNSGDNNDFYILQQGTGNHIAAITPGQGANNASNNNNNFTISQTGAGNHTASILSMDTSSNSNNTASITQSGGVGANKQFTLQLQGSGIGATVVQDNATTPDSASMSIQCVSPPCSGYSYTKH